MNSQIKRLQVWLGVGAVAALCLYSIIPVPRDNPRMKIYSTSNGDDFSGCEFSDEEKSGRVFRFYMTPDDCRMIDYGGNVFTISIEHPSMKVVKSWSGESVVTIRMYPISRASFHEGAVLDGVTPSKIAGGFTFYDYGGLTTLTFGSLDGETVFATDHGRYWLAKRLYKDLWVSSQYARKHNDTKSMDSFVMGFLKRAERRQIYF